MKNETDASTFKLGALIKTSLVDFPQCVSSVLFLHGCNLRCPYCYNIDLVVGTTSDYDSIITACFEEFLEKRKNVITGIVFSGGEPLLYPDLKELIIFARKLGYKIKLDTNGTLPHLLEKIIQNPETKPDYIALDIKTAPCNYNICAGFDAEEKIISSINILKAFDVKNYEIRSVFVPPLIDKMAIKTIASYLSTDVQWYFSPFQNTCCLDSSYEHIAPYTAREMEELVNFAKRYIPNSYLR
ncbi:MAG: anaerobic ribonucleoside-triphosphate reductase activating protein [Treponemataceae bacterium]